MYAIRLFKILFILKMFEIFKGMLNKKLEKFFCVEISAAVKFEGKLLLFYKEVYPQIRRLHKKSPHKKKFGDFVLRPVEISLITEL